MKTIVELAGVEFCYASSDKPVVEIQKLAIAEGESVFLFGPSGSGKTTLLEILAGVLAPQKGKVLIRDQDLASMTASQRDSFRAAHIGYVFQSFNLIPYLNVVDNILLPIHLSAERFKNLSGKKPSDEALNLCKRLGISDLFEKSVTELSVGQQQRVAVARALLGSPKIILADEPTSALDQDHREKFIRLLFEVANSQGTTVLFVSHDRTLEPLFSRSLAIEALRRSVL
jgi:putative ABC transport system ATP-binding protein